MPLDLLSLPAAEAELIAYSEGFVLTAKLFARLADLESERDGLLEELEHLKADLYAAKHDHSYGQGEAQ